MFSMLVCVFSHLGGHFQGTVRVQHAGPGKVRHLNCKEPVALKDPGCPGPHNDFATLQMGEARPNCRCPVLNLFCRLLASRFALGSLCFCHGPGLFITAVLFTSMCLFRLNRQVEIWTQCPNEGLEGRNVIAPGRSQVGFLTLCNCF